MEKLKWAGLVEHKGDVNLFEHGFGWDELWPGTDYRVS